MVSVHKDKLHPNVLIASIQKIKTEKFLSWLHGVLHTVQHWLFIFILYWLSSGWCLQFNSIQLMHLNLCYAASSNKRALTSIAVEQQACALVCMFVTICWKPYWYGIDRVRNSNSQIYKLVKSSGIDYCGKWELGKHCAYICECVRVC